eukprot:TRINITY_DN4086_c0_g1_i15.p1 TRINITY_DN4086_c0_g1~~TRINITY_DN4086_c0_g1_i15.p1  ORF type:complete len:288 (-),score=62.32 TRINITY_DN4086_c0_g1_i15:145-1008(-)
MFFFFFFFKQKTAYEMLRSLVGSEMCIRDRYDTVDTRVKALKTIAEQATGGMQLMYIEILNEISLPQVFLWMQEKTLFGEVSLLFNPQPGVHFTASDMVRNLILSCYMDRTLEDQEGIFRTLWIEPFDSRFGSPADFDRFLAAFIDAKYKRTRGDEGAPPGGLGRVEEAVAVSNDTLLMPPPPHRPQSQCRSRHVGATEKLILQITKGQNPQKIEGLLLYGKYVSLMEEINEGAIRDVAAQNETEDNIERDAAVSRQIELSVQALVEELKAFYTVFSSRVDGCLIEL